MNPDVEEEVLIYPIAIHFHGLDYSENEEVTIELTHRYDEIVQQSNEVHRRTLNTEHYIFLEEPDWQKEGF